jgi:hypothetical protein
MLLKHIIHNKLNKMKYTLEYFRDKFRAIPENLWCMGSFSEEGDRHCALGHCGNNSFMRVSPEGRALIEFARLYGKPRDGRLKITSLQEAQADTGNYSIPDVNDRFTMFKEWGDTPKQRVLGYIDYMIQKKDNMDTQPAVDQAVQIIGQVKKYKLELATV